MQSLWPCARRSGAARPVSPKTILFGLTGTGYFDMVAYDKFNRGELEDHIPTDEELERGFATIPSIPGIQ